MDNHKIKKQVKFKTKITKKKKSDKPKKFHGSKVQKALSKNGLKNKKMSFRERLKEQMKASQFRYFNEQFYISTSTEAQDYFRKNPEEFQIYHEGYEHQAALWPVNPIDEFIKEFRRRPKSDKCEIIADFGCGSAKLAQSLSGSHYKVFSFDLVAVNEYVTACDMAHTNLFNGSVDIVVFCLSLMGSDISQFIREANRVLKENGLMKIAEVKSRFEKIDHFISDVEKFGFTLLKKNLNNTAFYYFDFRKKSSITKTRKKKLPEIELKPCLYKHR